MKPVSTEYLTAKQAAAFLNLSPKTLEKWRNLGIGPAYKKFGRNVMYKITELDAWAETCTRHSTSEV